MTETTPTPTRMPALPAIRNVTLVGGTHGNELTGIYLLRKWQQQPELISRDSFQCETVLANPQAMAANKRYLDCDLNRQFRSDDLANTQLANYEQSRAKALAQQLGPKNNPASDFVIDLHNTTSNMGPCLLLVQHHPLYHRLAAYVKLHMPEAVIVVDEAHKSRDEHHLLCTLGQFGVIVEVGPQPQGVLRQDVFEQTEQMTGLILDFLELHNQGNLPVLPPSVEAFHYVKCLHLPVDENGERIGMVHQSVQDQDFQPLNPGDPLFVTFDGEVRYNQEARTLYPSFVNEAAYYDNNLALSLCEKIELDVE